MVKFEFKRNMWINHQATHRYRPSAPVTGGSAGGIDRAGSNASGTVHPERPAALPATWGLQLSPNERYRLAYGRLPLESA
jgi:hypothetical protein